jgi:hypothetical protein
VTVDSLGHQSDNCMVTAVLFVSLTGYSAADQLVTKNSPCTGCPRENHLVLAMMNLDNCMNDAKVLWDEAFVVFRGLGCVTHYSYCG